MREIRRAVLLNRGSQDDFDSDTEWENTESVAGTVTSLLGISRPESATTDIDEYPDISGITNAREAMKKLPEEDKAKIEQQVGGGPLCQEAFLPFSFLYYVRPLMAWLVIL